MKFICTNKGRFSVHGGGMLAEFVNGEFETDNIAWLDVLKNVQGVQVIEGADKKIPAPFPENQQDTTLTQFIGNLTPDKKKPGHPTKKDKK